ncbi:DUF3761 domain-containing protein [Actinoallomurus purpureus]|uniref:DUF3761 domain-containing protein n=1 Tax=Actinoallomurus purpureus TaxID=478114 RepID=UPI00209272E7|nr:DUF3761 domain-containing protein [Actinoallomurus purpureus]MCO6009472.1 DUF3761 domain-containing protein [Actinoallomurus purpureus]
MRHRTSVLILAAALLLGGCGTTATGAGGIAAPSAWPGESTTPADSPPGTPEPSATEESSTPTTRAGAGGAHTHKPHSPTTHRTANRAKRHHSAPKPPGHPAGATALCNDGTYSYAAHHQGACSHHGGVAVFYR